MIGQIMKMSKGSTKNRIRYILGAKKHDHDIQGIELVSTNCLNADAIVHAKANNEAGIDALIEEMDLVTKYRDMELGTSRKINPVFHSVLSLTEGETLSAKRWGSIVEDYLKDMGFKHTNKHYAVVHRDTKCEHVHIVANRIEMFKGNRKMIVDGKEESVYCPYPIISSSNDRETNMEAVIKIEKKYGLEVAMTAAESNNKTLPDKEYHGAISKGELPYRHLLLERVVAARDHTVDKKGNMVDFIKALRKMDVYIHITYADVQETKPKGITFEYKDRCTAGKKLKRDRFTWQRLIGQEGIKYDEAMLPDIKRESRKRNTKAETRAVEGGRQFVAHNNYYYFLLIPHNKAWKHKKFKVKRGILEETLNKMKSGDQVRAEIAYREAMELVEIIIALFKSLFTVKPAKPGRGFDEMDFDGCVDMMDRYRGASNTLGL